MSRAMSARPLAKLSCLALLSTALCACGIKESIERRVEERVAEAVIEIAADSKVEIDSDKGQLSIEGEDGSRTHIDGQSGKVVVTDADGKIHEYVQGEDGSARVTGSDGLDAKVGTKLPEGFPLTLPPLREVMSGQRIEQPDGQLLFSVMAQASSTDIAAMATTLRAELEAKGLAVEKSEVSTDEGKVITLQGKDEAAKIEAGCMLSTSTDAEHPGVVLVVTWSDTHARAVAE